MITHPESNRLARIYRKQVALPAWQVAGGLSLQGGYPRLGQRGRLFWRDLYAVAGLWVSLLTLFLLLSGLPWSTTWGNYFAWARNQWAATAGTADWPIGGEVKPAARVSQPAASMPALPAETMATHGHGETLKPPLGFDLRALDKFVPIAAQLHPPRPVWISPPSRGEQDWQIESRAQNRPMRVVYKVAPDSGLVTGRAGFAEKNVWIAWLAWRLPCTKGSSSAA